MQKLLDFEGEEKGYTKIYPSAENFKKHIGDHICYVDFVEPYRGTYFVRYGIISAVKRGILYLNDYERQLSISEIKECGVRTLSESN